MFQTLLLFCACIMYTGIIYILRVGRSRRVLPKMFAGNTFAGPGRSPKKNF